MPVAPATRPVTAPPAVRPAETPPATRTPIEQFSSALDRADVSLAKSFGVLQSISDGHRVGSTRLDDHLRSIGRDLSIAILHAGRADKLEAMAPLANAAAGAYFLSKEAVVPKGLHMFTPDAERKLLEGGTTLLVDTEKLIGDVRNAYKMPAASGIALPAKDDPVQDVRLLAWMKRIDGSDPKTALPADLVARYADKLPKPATPPEAQSATPPEAQSATPPEAQSATPPEAQPATPPEAQPAQPPQQDAQNPGAPPVSPPAAS